MGWEELCAGNQATRVAGLRLVCLQTEEKSE
jgi:hypothetical protein